MMRRHDTRMPALKRMKQKDFFLRDIVIDQQVMPEFDFSNSGQKIFGVEKTDFSLKTKDEKYVLNHMHSHNFYLVALFQDADFDYEVNMTKTHLSGNVVVLLHPGQYHQFVNVKKATGYVICFKEGVFELLSPLYSSRLTADLFLNISYVIIENDDTMYLMENMFRQLIKIEANQQVDNQKNLSESLIITLLSTLYDSPDLKCGKLANQDLGAPRRDMYLSFAAMVEQEFKGIHTVKEYANRLGVSQRVLSLCTHDNVKKTPLTIINERLLLEAKRKLRFTSLRVSEIAYYLGFVDASHFVAFFKKHTGCTPLVYRTACEQNADIS